MNINAVVMGLLTLLFGFYATKAFFHKEILPPSELPWVPIKVGVERSFTSMTRDAGMYTERARRTAIISNPYGTVGYKGSDNGSMEWNFLTSICVCPPRNPICPIVNVIDDGGNAGDEICDVIDANGGDVLDFGNADTNVCDV